MKSDSYEVNVIMKLTVELYTRDKDENYVKKFKGVLVDRNILVDEQNLLPGFDYKFINFVADYSIAYELHSKGLVNTRLRYPENSGKAGDQYVYCKLNWAQRVFLLNHIQRNALYQKYPIAYWVLILTFIGTLYTISKDLLTTSNSKNVSVGQPTIPETLNPNQVDTSTELIGITSITKLIVTPDQFHNKYVSVTGFMNVEFEGDGIYIHKEDYDKSLFSNGLWIELTEKQIKDIDSLKLNKKYVLLEGTFNKNGNGHMGLWSGEINRITRIISWEH